MKDHFTTARTKIRKHFERNQLAYGFCGGILVSVITTGLFYRKGIALDNAAWDAAEKFAYEKDGDSAIVTRDRNGRFGHFTPTSDETD